MASHYMRIQGAKPKGAATATLSGGVSLAKDGWFAISRFQWGAVRSVSMQIGDGANADSGMAGLQEVIISKTLCGASEEILSCMFLPGPTGHTIDLIATKPGRDDKGLQVYLQLKLEKARIVSYSIDGAGDNQPKETLSIAYDIFRYQHWHETVGGQLEAGGKFAFSLATGAVMSGDKIKGD